MKTRVLISLLLFAGILALAYLLPSAEARSLSSFRWDIDETYHREGHVQLVVQKGSENFLPIGIKGLDDVTVTLHPTINHDQTGMAKLPRGVDIYFEPDVVTLTDGEVKPVKLMINVDEDAPSNLYDVQIVGTWKEEGKIPDFMGSSIRLHVGRDFGDGKIPINMLESPLKFWKLIKNEGGNVEDVPCRNDYVLAVKHDGSPVCITYQTGVKLLERGWITCDDGISHNRGHPCGPRSSGIISFNLENYKEQSIVIIPKGAVIEGNENLIPKVITVILGKNNTVTWINEDDVPHGIASDVGGDNFWGTPGVLKPEESYSVTFEETGVFSYHGQPHPWITGSVIVLENDSIKDISKNGISEKRSPVDVPNATSENDMYCNTNWNIVTENRLDMTHIKQSTQSTIAQFGETYFLEERIIDVWKNSEGYTVSISGLWDRDSVQYEMIAQDLEKFGTIQGEPASCQ